MIMNMCSAFGFGGCVDSVGLTIGRQYRFSFENCREKHRSRSPQNLLDVPTSERPNIGYEIMLPGRTEVTGEVNEGKAILEKPACLLENFDVRERGTAVFTRLLV
jgi:hypothetical protein